MIIVITVLSSGHHRFEKYIKIQGNIVKPTVIIIIREKIGEMKSRALLRALISTNSPINRASFSLI